MKCKVCGTILTSDAYFCSECGTLTTDGGATTRQKEYVTFENPTLATEAFYEEDNSGGGCSKCGTKYQEDIEYCEMCGASITVNNSHNAYRHTASNSALIVAVCGLSLALVAMIIVVFMILKPNVIPQNSDATTDGRVIGKPSIGISIQDTGYGLFIDSIAEGSGAQEAGLKVYDMILEVDGQEVSSTEEVYEIRDEKKIDDYLTFKIVRDGEFIEIPVRLIENQTDKNITNLDLMPISSLYGYEESSERKLSAHESYTCPEKIPAGKYIATGNGFLTIYSGDKVKVMENLDIAPDNLYAFSLESGQRLKITGDVNLIELK